jgi:hypothetical protein
MHIARRWKRRKTPGMPVTGRPNQHIVLFLKIKYNKKQVSNKTRVRPNATSRPCDEQLSFLPQNES